MPSLTYGVAFGVRKTLGVGLVLGEQQLRRAVARRASTLPSCVMRSAAIDAGRSTLRCSVGADRVGRQDQVLRNHSVGSTCSVAASGPRLCTVIRIRMSSGDALAYSTNTSK